MTEFSRQRILFEALHLLSADRFVSLNDLADAVKVSKRTIQHDLDRLQEWLAEQQLDQSISIERKTGRGIRMVLRNITREEATKRFSSDLEEVQSQGNYERRIEIIKLLLFSQDSLTIQFFADQFYVSKNVIQKDLDWISKWLAPYRLSLGRYRSRGVVLAGDEIARRRLIADLVGDASQHDPAEYDLPAFSDPVNLLRLDLSNFYQSIHRRPKTDVGRIADIIRNAEQKFQFQLSDTYYTGLLVHLSIAMERLTSGLGVVSRQEVPDNLDEEPANAIAAYIAQQLQESFSIQVPPAEQTLICIHIIGAVASTGEHTPSNAQALEDFAYRLAKVVEQLTGLPFSDDQILLMGLATHIKASTFRLRSGLMSTGPLQEKFCCEYPLLYYAVWVSGCLYSPSFSVLPNREELIAIYHHFLFSFHRQKQQMCCLLVHNDGAIQASRMMRQLKRYEPQLLVADCCTLSQLRLLPALTRERYQVILSTIPIDTGEVPLFQIPNRLNSEECRKLEEFLHQPTFRRLHCPSAVLPTVTLDADCTSPDALAEYLAGYLTCMGYQKEAVDAELLELERNGRSFVHQRCFYYVMLLTEGEREQIFSLHLSGSLFICGEEVDRMAVLALRKETLVTKPPDKLAQYFAMLLEKGEERLPESGFL